MWAAGGLPLPLSSCPIDFHTDFSSNLSLTSSSSGFISNQVASCFKKAYLSLFLKVSYIICVSRFQLITEALKCLCKPKTSTSFHACFQPVIFGILGNSWISICLATQHEFVMADPLACHWGYKEMQKCVHL